MKVPELRTALDQIASGYFCPNDPHQFAGFVDNLLNHDRFKVCADFEAYLQCQDLVSEAFKVSSCILTISLFTPHIKQIIVVYNSWLIKFYCV